MIVHETDVLIKNNEFIKIRSLGICHEAMFIEFFNSLYLEQSGARTLVEDYKNKLNSMKLIIESACDSPTNFILGAFAENKLIGVADFFDSTFEVDPHPVGEIGVSINNSYRNLGIATALLKVALNAIEATAIRELMLTVVAANESAIQIYSKLGFQISKKYKNSNDQLAYEMNKMVP